jgi:hypothetical protein
MADMKSQGGRMLKTSVIILTSTLTTLLPIRDGRGRPSYSSSDRQSLRKTVTFHDPMTERTIRVDNIFGSIDVKGGPIEVVRIKGEKILRAESRHALEKARREVRLDVTEKDNMIDIIVNGPFRRADGRVDWGDIGYIAQYDFELQVPESVNLILKTVNDGQIVVRNVSGRLKVGNVNGRIEMDRISGSVGAHTVNGDIRALFKDDPDEDCRFKTVNGTLHLSFSSDLSADFALKTFHGEIRTDFPATSLPARSVKKTKWINGKKIYRYEHSQRVRIGKGGLNISMETLNGDLVIAKR